MHPDKRIVRMYRHSDGLYMRPNDPNILNRQSAGTKIPHGTRYIAPLHGTLPGTALHYLYVYGYVCSPGISSAVAIATSTPPH